MLSPDTIDLKSLPWLPLNEKSAFPKQAAIYFAIDSQGCVQYIGRSVNVRARWGSHHKYESLSAIGNIRIAYLFVDMPELLPQIETALIEYFQPILNIRGLEINQTEGKSARGKRYEEMSKKLNAIIPDETWEALEEIAKREMRTKSQMAAILLGEAIAARKAESLSLKKDKGAA